MPRLLRPTPAAGLLVQALVACKECAPLGQPPFLRWHTFHRLDTATIEVRQSTTLIDHPIGRMRRSRYGGRSGAGAIDKCPGARFHTSPPSRTAVHADCVLRRGHLLVSAEQVFELVFATKHAVCYVAPHLCDEPRQSVAIRHVSRLFSLPRLRVWSGVARPAALGPGRRAAFFAIDEHGV